MGGAESFGARLEERIERFLSALSPRPSRTPVRLAGDASNRLYFRLELDSGENRILAALPSPFAPRALPFLEVRDLLSRIPLRVPRVFEVSGELGMLLLEDLGDWLLQDEVRESASPARTRELYLEAVSILERLQRRGRELANEAVVPFRIAFDETKFFQELSFFRVHFLEGLRGAELLAADRAELDAEFRRLASELSAQPYALCHRDYHSRNLVVCDEELAIIDFQDARMGPRCYDLVSLLNDSYVALPEELLSELQEVFARSVGADVASEYDPAALQRNLKALGTFGFQISVGGNEVYRPYLPHTLALVRGNLERNPRWDRLGRTLAKLLPELA